MMTIVKFIVLVIVHIVYKQNIMQFHFVDHNNNSNTKMKQHPLEISSKHLVFVEKKKNNNNNNYSNHMMNNNNDGRGI